MKKVMLGLALVASSMTFAQQFGAKAGANFSSISKDGYEDTKMKTGFYAGIFMNAPLAEKLSIQPEVIYNNMGATVTSSNTAFGKVESKLNLDYISVPVMFQYNVSPEFYLEAGPQFSFLVSAKTKTTFDNKDIKTTDWKELNKDNFNGFDFGLGIGAGFWFTPNIGINARYMAGLSGIGKDQPTSVSNEKNNNRNNGFQVGVGFKF